MKRPIESAPRLVLLLVVLALASGTSYGDVDREIRKTFDVRAGGELTLDADRGSISVRTHRAERIDVRLTLRADTRSKSRAEEIFDDFEVDFRPSGANLEIESKYDGPRGVFGWFGNSGNLQAKWEIVVPERYTLDLRTSGGSIEVEDLNGDVEARTSGGSLKFGRVGGQVTGRTSGGSITIDETAGQVDVSSSGGSVRIDRARGPVRARTSGGSITVNEVFGSIDAVTSGGSIRAAISAQPASDCRLSTSGGNVSVELAPAIAVDLDARSSGGSVTTDLPVTIRGEMGRNRLSGTINGGGPALVLRTSGGGISIRQR